MKVSRIIIIFFKYDIVSGERQVCGEETQEFELHYFENFDCEGMIYFK